MNSLYVLKGTACRGDINHLLLFLFVYVFVCVHSKVRLNGMKKEIFKHTVPRDWAGTSGLNFKHSHAGMKTASNQNNKGVTLIKSQIRSRLWLGGQCVSERPQDSHFREASPTLRQPLRLSCLRKPPQRLEMFSTTRPWETQGQREGGRERERERKRDRERNMSRSGPQDRGSAVTSHWAPKPTDPALSLGLDNATQHSHTHAAHTVSTSPHTQILSIFFPLSCENTPLTSMSVWKLNKSIFCQLLPSRARTFHAWKSNRQVVDRDRQAGQTGEGGRWLSYHNVWQNFYCVALSRFLYTAEFLSVSLLKCSSRLFPITTLLPSRTSETCRCADLLTPQRNVFTLVCFFVGWSVCF